MSAISSSRKTDAGTALGEAAKIYSRHAFTIVGVSILIQTVALVAMFFVMGSSGSIVMQAVSRVIPLTGGMLLSGALTIVLLSVRETGTVPPMSELISRALPKVPRLFLLSWATGILVSFAMIALILPGLYVFLRLALAPSLMIMGGQGVSDSMKSSWAITGQAKWSVFVLVLFQFFCTFGVSYLSYKAMGGAFAAEENVMVAEAFITALLVPIPTLAFADLTLRLSGVFPDPVTGMRMGNTTEGPAHRVHVPGGAAPMPGNQVVGAHVPTPYGAPQPAPAYGAPQMPSPYAGQQPIQPQPQALWNQAPQPQAAQAAAHPHFSEPPMQPYAPPAPVNPATLQPQPYATQGAQPYAQPPQPYAPPQPHAQQPYAPPQPQPYAQSPYAPAPTQPQPQPYAQQPAHQAPAQPQPYAPPHPHAQPPGAAPAPPARPSVAPPGMG
ncbi:MAG: YciC family protein [Solirubrobacteraceae bacterium]|nr:YciC family protein [Solirubrobacteraceae bacterium]